MNPAGASVALRRAAEISRELAAVADSGDVDAVQRLDAERLLLLKSARGLGHRWSQATGSYCVRSQN